MADHKKKRTHSESSEISLEEPLPNLAPDTWSDSNVLDTPNMTPKKSRNDVASPPRHTDNNTADSQESAVRDAEDDVTELSEPPKSATEITNAKAITHLGLTSTITYAVHTCLNEGFLKLKQNEVIYPAMLLAKITQEGPLGLINMINLA